MLLWLGTFAACFVAEFLADAWSVFYTDACRRLQRRKAVGWGILLGFLSWIDLAGLAAGFPVSALLLGSVLGGAAGTHWSVGQNMIQKRLKRAAKRAT